MRKRCFIAVLLVGLFVPAATAQTAQSMFDEATHAFGVGGRIRAMIEEECARQKLPVPPELWHFMIMFTTGELARRELERTGSPGYVPYVYRYNQLPPAVLAAFERHWLPYLEGKAPFEQSLSGLVRDAR